MMSLGTIQELSARAAERAAERELIPFVPFDAAEVEGWDSFPFPNLGDHRPEGWELVDSLFCDASGLGAANEPALTTKQLKASILANIPESYGYAIIQEGQFQVYVGRFKRL